MSSPMMSSASMMPSSARTAALGSCLLVHAMITDSVFVFIDKITANIIPVAAYAVSFRIRTPAVIADPVSILIDKAIILSTILTAAMIRLMCRYR